MKNTEILKAVVALSSNCYENSDEYMRCKDECVFYENGHCILMQNKPFKYIHTPKKLLDKIGEINE